MPTLITGDQALQLMLPFLTTALAVSGALLAVGWVAAYMIDHPLRLPRRVRLPRALLASVVVVGAGCAIDPLDGEIDETEQELDTGVVATPSVLDLGAVPVGGKRTLPVTLTNQGKTSIQCNASLVDDLALSVSTTWISELAPGKSITIDVTYEPTKAATLAASYFLDDGERRVFSMPVRGKSN